MTACFAFDVDPALSLVRIRMGGFFGAEEIGAFIAARNDAFGQLVCPPNMHVTLTDLRDMKIQSQDMVEAFREVLATPEYRSRRLAFVMPPTLARTQLFRALDKRHARFFEDPAAAEAWLLASDSAAAA